MSNGSPVSDLVSRLFRGDTFVVMSPEAIKRAVEKGMATATVKPDISPEDAINNLFEVRRNRAKENASKILPYPDCDEEILHLYDQIGLCILFDMHGAAIMFCGILVEYALKRATFISETRDNVEFDLEKWKKFEKIRLKKATDRAKKSGLIDQEQAKNIERFADEVRNPYAHFNLQKITEEMVYSNAVEMNIETGQTKVVDILASCSPVYMRFAKEGVDKESVDSVFSYCDKVVRYLWSRLPAR